MFTVLKIVLSALIIVAVSEIAKRSTMFGALVASLPLTSLLAITWLYLETKNVEKVAALSSDILWLVIPSLLFFGLFPFLLRAQLSFALSMGISLVAMLLAYRGAIALRSLFGS